MQQMRLRFIQEMLGELRSGDGRTLIVGCGSGYDVFLTEGRALAIDVAFSALKRMKDKTSHPLFVNGDGFYLPFRNSSIRCVICSEVLEHVLDPKGMIQEFERVLKKEGVLILTVPNVTSLYGLARAVAEFTFRRPFHAGDQPIDHWFRASELRRLLTGHFRILETRGIWYNPPTGKGACRIPDSCSYPVFRLFVPLERIFSKTIPTLGHMLAVKCMKERHRG